MSLNKLSLHTILIYAAPFFLLGYFQATLFSYLAIRMYGLEHNPIDYFSSNIYSIFLAIPDRLLMHFKCLAFALCYLSFVAYGAWALKRLTQSKYILRYFLILYAGALLAILILYPFSQTYGLAINALYVNLINIMHSPMPFVSLCLMNINSSNKQD